MSQFHRFQLCNFRHDIGVVEIAPLRIGGCCASVLAATSIVLLPWFLPLRCCSLGSLPFKYSIRNFLDSRYWLTISDQLDDLAERCWIWCWWLSARVCGIYLMSSSLGWI
jgi:hypothetical protein